jgi:hypothetical protein
MKIWIFVLKGMIAHGHGDVKFAHNALDLCPRIQTTSLVPLQCLWDVVEKLSRIR